MIIFIVFLTNKCSLGNFSKNINNLTDPSELLNGINTINIYMVMVLHIHSLLTLSSYKNKSYFIMYFHILIFKSGKLHMLNSSNINKSNTLSMLLPQLWFYINKDVLVLELPKIMHMYQVKIRLQH